MQPNELFKEVLVVKRRKRPLNTFVCASLILVMMLGTGSTALAVVKQAGSVDRDLLYPQIWDKYIQLEEFQQHLENDPDDAKAMIERIVEAEIRSANRQKSDKIGPMGGNDGIGGITSPMFPQRDGVHCGPANALTAIYGMGKESQVSGSTYNAKQLTLGVNMGTDSTGTDVYRMRNELNKYAVNGMSYTYYENPSKDTLMWGMLDGAITDNAAILHAYTDGFDYYGGYRIGHYVTVVWANIWGDDDDKYYQVMDNYINRPGREYYGVHAVSLNEVKAAVPSGRYLICPTW